MGIFGTSKADLIKEVAKTGALLTAALNDLHIERSQHRHTKAELKVFTDRRDRAKLNLRQYRGSNGVVGNNEGTLNNGTAAAVQGVEL